MQTTRSRAVSKSYTRTEEAPINNTPEDSTSLEDPISLSIQLLANYQLKPSRAELSQQSFPDTKEVRLKEKIRLLKNQDFPTQNDQEVQELFESIRQLKHEFPNEWRNRILTIQKQRYEIDIIPVTDNDGHNRHEIIVSFPYSDKDPYDYDPKKEIETGTFKDVNYAWLIGKTAKKIVRAVTYFNNEEKNSKKTSTQKKATEKLRKDVSERETLYLNKFKGIKGFPEIYKSYHLYETDSPLKGRNILIMKAYGSDLARLWESQSVENRFTDYEKVSLVLKMFEPIKKLHKEGHCHVDVKLENYLLSKNNDVVLCDFGFACKITDKEEISKGLGTTGYMSWEKLRYNFGESSALSSEEMLASDIWSAGQNALYLLWKVQIPYPDRYKISQENLCEIKKGLKILEKAEPPASEPLSHLMWQTMHRDYTKRPTAKEVVKELKKIKETYKDPSKTLAESTYWPEMQKKLHKIFPVSPSTESSSSS